MEIFEHMCWNATDHSCRSDVILKVCTTIPRPIKNCTNRQFLFHNPCCTLHQSIQVVGISALLSRAEGIQTTRWKGLKVWNKKNTWSKEWSDPSSFCVLPLVNLYYRDTYHFASTIIMGLTRNEDNLCNPSARVSKRAVSFQFLPIEFYKPPSSLH